MRGLLLTLRGQVFVLSELRLGGGASERDRRGGQSHPKGLELFPGVDFVLEAG